MRIAIQLAGAIAAFVLGAALSGVSLLLLASIPMLERQWIVGAWTAAMACGLQNAMATTYSGAVVRTTHLSGMFTDIGIAIGHALRRMPLQTRRLRLSMLIIAGFLCGAATGSLLFQAWSYRALLVPAGLTGAAGLTYTLYRHWQISNHH